MTTDVAQVTEIVAGVREHWTTRRNTVRALAELLRVKQTVLADGLGMSRQAFNGRMTGATRLQPEELAGIAVMLGVPEDVLDLDELGAHRYVVEHAQELGFPRNRRFLQAA